MIKNINLWMGLAWILILSLVACSNPSESITLPSSTSIVNLTPSSTSTPMVSPTFTSSPTATKTNTPTKTSVPSSTDTPSATPIPSITPSPTITPTPTVDFPDVTINVANAHCRYGPGKAYLHAADLYEGDHGLVWNRNYAGTWLWVRFDKLHYACWVAASLLDIAGDVFSVSTYIPSLPKSTLYGPPHKVVASRDGDQVVVAWEEVWMTDDDYRGYLIEARVCQNDHLVDLALHTNTTSYTFLDQKKCDGESKGRLYAVEKHGYTDPVPIPWP